MRLPTFVHGMLRQIASSRTGTWLAGCALATACFVAVCVAALVAARSDADRQAEAVASGAAAIAAHDIARTLERFDIAMQAIIGRLQSPAVTALEEPMRSMVLFDPASGIQSLGFINVLDENGSVTESPQPSERLSRWTSRDYFTEQRLNPSLGVYVSRPFGQQEYASIALSRRVSNQDGTFGGVIVASLRLNSIRDLFGQLTLGSHGSITLQRNDGTVLMRLPFDGNDIGRIYTPGSVADHVRRSFVSRQIGELPLSVQVGVASQDVAVAWRGWTVAILAAGALLASISIALVVVLQGEVWRREAAERDNRHKSDYLAMASHELRTPLHSILGNAERLRADAAMAPADARRVAAIVSAGNHLRSVVNRVLNQLLIESRLPTPRMRRVDLAELLDHCCIIVESHAAAQGLTLRLDLTGAPEQFVTDHDLLLQVLVNLLTNAVKFTARGEVAIEVSGTTERITIEVKDTGCGIPPAQRHKLFKYGERLGAERTAIAGHGIGLAMSRRLVQCMSGDIGFRENTGGGSIFWVGLPAGKLPEQVASEPSVAASARGPLQVLLVDDVAANREIARVYLIERGHAVTEAEGGADAVQLASDHDFDVVLMDMRMPGMDGVEATKRIRMIAGERGQVPIVAVTAKNALDEQIVAGRRAGMVEHLVKPFTPDELLTIVERVARWRWTTPPPEQATFESVMLAQLAPYMSSGDMERHLLDLAHKVESLLRELNASELATDPASVADLTHELAGVAGMFGFAALSAAARRFEEAVEANPASAADQADALAVAARAALGELRELASAEPVGSA